MILAFLWIVMLVTALPILEAKQDGAEPPTIPASVDPNSAPWWELTVLPRIGRSTATKIVRYRESIGASSVTEPDTSAFTSAADLIRVRGIGPKTLERIAPYLAFPLDRQPRDPPSP